MTRTFNRISRSQPCRDSPWADAPIHVHGRDPLSGTAGFLKDQVLQGGVPKEKVREQAGSATIVMEIMKDPYAVGYSGIGYRTSGVRPVPLAVQSGDPSGDPFIEPSFETAMTGAYPLHRVLYLYVNSPPKGRLPLVIMEFLKFTSSQEGQSTVHKEGFFPLPARRLHDQMTALNPSLEKRTQDNADARR